MLSLNVTDWTYVERGCLNEPHPQIANLLHLCYYFEFYFQIYLTILTFKSAHIYQFCAVIFILRKAINIQANNVIFFNFLTSKVTRMIIH